jgi:hypothetical protein
MLLTGCGAGSGDSAAAKPKGNASTPASRSADSAFVPARVGQCWNATVAQGEASSWEGHGAVACTAKHNALTYAVATLPEDPGFGRAGTHKLPAVITDTQCNYDRALKYVGHTLSSPVRLSTLLYRPTPAQYLAGARQVRCDLAVKEGTVYRALPSRLTAAAFAAPAYQVCSTAAHASGPDDGDASYAPCTSASTFRLIKYVQLASSPNQPFPGAKVAFARTLKACPMLHNGDWIGHPTEAKAWAGGDTVGGCWRWLG